MRKLILIIPFIRSIWDKETFLSIQKELEGEYKILWRFLGETGLRLESALLLQKKYLFNDSLLIEHRKAGKRGEVNLLNQHLINFQEGTITFRKELYRINLRSIEFLYKKKSQHFSSVESSHNRISIMQFILIEMLKGKIIQNLI